MFLVCSHGARSDRHGLARRLGRTVIAGQTAPHPGPPAVPDERLISACPEVTAVFLLYENCEVGLAPQVHQLWGAHANSSKSYRGWGLQFV
jgi:hypothetical protein